MIGISGFTFIHNALAAGYPIYESIMAVLRYVDEIVVVDMQSTDGTREFLSGMRKVHIIDGVWEPGTGGACLAKAHAQHEHCKNDVILHFEADEVYDHSLVQYITEASKTCDQMAVWRLQVSQNFQRIRWYPTPVHRVFRKGSVTKEGESTREHKSGKIVPLMMDPSCGFLWDVTNCFRDNYLTRCMQQAELWGGRVHRLSTQIHSTLPAKDMTEDEAKTMLEEPHWTWTRSPLALPDELHDLVGMTTYWAHEWNEWNEWNGRTG